MKNIFRYLGVVLVLIAFSCNEDVDLLTEDAKVGGLLTPTSTSLNYVVGDPEGPYTLEFLVQQGKAQIDGIRIYKSFTTTETYTEIVDGEEVVKDTTFTSNEVLDRTIDVSQDGYHLVSSSYTLAELVEGLKINSMSGPDNDLPMDDGQYSIGDRWNLRVVSVMADGREVEQAYSVGIAVSTRYAGVYRTLDAVYYRLGVLTYTEADWPTETVIESVDATTYRVVEYFGAFSGNTWYFQIEDGVISYPAETPEGDAQTGNGAPLITCESNPADMVGVNCDNTNFVVNNDETGEDQLVMSYGYYTAGSGPRVFYHVLEKIVD